MDMITMRPMNKQEAMYCYSQSVQLISQTGNIGYLRADLGKDGNEFFSMFCDFNRLLKTEDFKENLDMVINYIRGDFLKSRSALSKFCYSKMIFPINDKEFGLKVDSGKFTYMMRLNPNRGEYNLYCYCYGLERLSRHLTNALKGIRFINSRYNELFRIDDGDRIVIHYPDGPEEKICRYIDDYHVEIGSSLFHICEFAELMESKNAKVTPA